jgi:gamma-glutamylcyclotransferase (GGCT)/AIG2-like uncharacterized protein YtfP
MIQDDMPDHLFVYGTLRAESAHPMAHRLRIAARHIGRGSTPGVLYDFGSWPGAFFGPEPKYRVIGNVFVLGAGQKLLAELDKYEGVTPAQGDGREWPEAEGLFRRIAVTVALDKGGTVKAWAYGLKARPLTRLIGNGDFIADRRFRAPSPLRP